MQGAQMPDDKPWQLSDKRFEKCFFLYDFINATWENKTIEAFQLALHMGRKKKSVCFQMYLLLLLSWLRKCECNV